MLLSIRITFLVFIALTWTLALPATMIKPVEVKVDPKILADREHSAKPSVDRIREEAANAIGSQLASGVWSFKGITNRRGLWQTFEMVADTDFRYRIDVQGPLRQSDGFDRRLSWKLGVSGVPHPTILTDREVPRMVSSVIAGSWTAPGAPFAFQILPSDPDSIELEMKCLGGRVPASLFLNPKTYRVERLTHWGADGEDVWAFSDYKREAGAAVPTRIDHLSGSSNESIVIQSVRFDRSRSISFSIPRSESSGFKFDRKSDHQVKVTYKHGHLFVQPMLDGAEEGWFVFDTGAGVMVIDSRIAAKHNSPSIGSESTDGVVSSSNLKICQGISFQLGPVTLNHPTYMQSDLTRLSKAFGLPIVGICGYDFISHAAIDIDIKSETMGLYEPGKAPLPHGINWIALEFDEDTPCISCKFEGDRMGLFAIDTGSNSAVDFLSPAVEKFGLLKSRALTSERGGSAGGADAAYEAGNIEWFEFAGRRYDKLPVGFQLTKRGTFASPFFEGFIGMKLMARSRLIFDYQKSRMAAIPYQSNGKP